METSSPSKRSVRLSRKRERLRDSFWPTAGNAVWSRKTSKGFTSIPRILPLVMRLIADLAEAGDASRAYFDLWCRAFDEGMTIVRDENEMAYSAGYSGPRAIRTWRERIETLRLLGFVSTREFGNRDIGHILILDPNLIVSHLRSKGRVDDEWWNAYLTRMSDIGAVVPEITREIEETLRACAPTAFKTQKSIQVRKAKKT